VQEPHPSLLKFGGSILGEKSEGSRKITGGGPESSLLARSPPIIDAFAIKAPIAANSECGNLSFSQQAIDRTWVDVQIFRDFRYSQNFIVVLHLATLKVRRERHRRIKPNFFNQGRKQVDQATGSFPIHPRALQYERNFPVGLL
jgi:hypothetical protein